MRELGLPNVTLRTFEVTQSDFFAWPSILHGLVTDCVARTIGL